MMIRFAALSFLLVVSAWHSEARATDAFVPPEAIPSGRYGVGVQVESAGRMLDVDSVKSREHVRVRCNGWGVPHVNPVPIEDVGRIRQVAVQLEDASYVWSEMKVSAPLDRFACQFGPKTLRNLTISRYDGKQTHVTRYNYETRKYGVQIAEGDTTHLGSSRSYTQTTPRKNETGEEKLIAGMSCTVQAITPGFMWHCLTKDHPVAGRKRPLSLSLRTPQMELEATAITPDVRVDLGTLDGPPGFQPMKAVKVPTEKQDGDVEAAVPRDVRRKP